MHCVVGGWQLAIGVMMCWLSLRVHSIVWNAGGGTASSFILFFRSFIRSDGARMFLVV
jgi:hypothetical protein